jgi:L-threonylcarbamoyladenylate synthase
MSARARVEAINILHPEEAKIALAARLIREGELVAFPTETVYGLGADATDSSAVERIYAAKSRPKHDPIIVHIAAPESLSLVAHRIPDNARRLADVFWPGPLTLVVPRAEVIPPIVSADMPTVAVRMPAHQVALALIREAGVPIAAPSANLFGHPSPTTAQHVLEDLGDRISLILDAGPATIGVESTVLDVSGDVPTLLRPGGISREAIESVIGSVQFSPLSGHLSDPGGFRSPGLMLQHYSPKAELLLFSGEATDDVVTAMRAKALELIKAGKHVGLMVADEDLDLFKTSGLTVEKLGSRTDLSQVAFRLFAAMRSLDQMGMDIILAYDFGAKGLGLAIQDRLFRASGGKVFIT